MQPLSIHKLGPNTISITNLCRVEYMLDHLGFTDRENALAKCTQLYIQHGTTYAGLAVRSSMLRHNL